MTGNFKYLPNYAKFLLDNHLREISVLYMDKIQELDSPFAIKINGLEEEKQIEYCEQNFKELLTYLSQNNPTDYINDKVENWKQNKLSNLAKNQSAVKDLLDTFKIRKSCFFSFLKKYDIESDKVEEILIEIVDFYNFYIEKSMQVYMEIQQDKLILEKDFSQSIINNVVSGISSFDTDWNVTEWNLSMENTYNIKKEDIMGKKLNDFFPGYEGSEEGKAFAKVLKGESIYLKDRKYRLRKGWYEAHLVPLLNKKQEVTGVLSISHDITLRKEAELKIQEDQYFINSIADTSPDVITVYDLEENKNIYSSKEIYTILGYSEEELKILVEKGIQGLVEVIHPEDLPLIIGFLESYKNYTGTRPRDLEYRIKDNKGEYRWIMDRYNVFKRSEAGLPIQILGIARDNTIRKNAEEEIKKANYLLHETNEELRRTEELLTEANNELEERVQQRTAEILEKNNQLLRINSDLDNFIYTASHDLKSPAVNLEGLMSHLNQQIGHKLDENDFKVMAMIHKSINKLNKTIIDLSEITKAQKDIDGEVEELSFLEMLEDVKSDIQESIENSGATIEHFLQVQNLVYNKGNLRSILYNLLSNAIKYRSDERLLIIKIQTFQINDQIVLCVEDNGLGIHEHQLPKMFTMFKRMHSHVEGTGIGLYIIKRIVENKGGKIEVESKINEGTKFKVIF